MSPNRPPQKGNEQMNHLMSDGCRPRTLAISGELLIYLFIKNHYIVHTLQYLIV